jgi:tetratricopeptide (TPR) repeat protein
MEIPRILFILILVGFCCFANLFAQSDSTKYHKRYQHALTLYKKGNFFEANDLFKACVREKPGDNNCLIHSAFCYLGMKSQTQADPVVQEHLETNFFSNLYLAAHDCFQQGLNFYEKAATLLKPQDSAEDSLSSQASDSSSSGRPGNSIADSINNALGHAARAFERGASSHPDSLPQMLDMIEDKQRIPQVPSIFVSHAGQLRPLLTDCNYNLGRTYMEWSEVGAATKKEVNADYLRKAIGAFKNAVMLDSNRVEALLKLGFCYQKLFPTQEKPEDQSASKNSAQFYLKRAGLKYLEIAREHIKAKRWPEAIENLEAAKKNFGAKLEIRFELAQIYAHVDSFKLALREFSRIERDKKLEDWPLVDDFRLAFTRFNAENGQIADARNQLAKLKNEVYQQIAKGYILFAEAQYDFAYVCFNGVLGKLDEADSGQAGANLRDEVRLYAGLSAERAGRYSEAQKQYEALEKKRDLAAISSSENMEVKNELEPAVKEKMALARQFIRRREWEHALGALREADQINHEYPGLQDSLNFVLAMKKRNETFEEYFTLANETFKSNAWEATIFYCNVADSFATDPFQHRRVNDLVRRAEVERWRAYASPPTKEVTCPNDIYNEAVDKFDQQKWLEADSLFQVYYVTCPDQPRIDQKLSLLLPAKAAGLQKASFSDTTLSELSNLAGTLASIYPLDRQVLLFGEAVRELQAKTSPGHSWYFYITVGLCLSAVLFLIVQSGKHKAAK